MIQDSLNCAAIHLTAAQSIIEDSPNVYSDQTWTLVTELLSVLTHIEERAATEESEGPLIDQDAYND